MTRPIVYHRGILDDEGRRRTPNEQTVDPHPCPYESDINDDRSTLCTCSPEQQRECESAV